MPPTSRRGPAPVPLLIGFALFLGLLGYLLASSLTRRTAPTYAPSPVGAAFRDRVGLEPVTLTLDARHETDWRFADLDRGIALPPGDSTGWDLAVRRFHIRAVSPVQRDSGEVLSPPTREFGRWYTYGATSHLLQPAGHRYRLTTDRGLELRVELLSYYCPGLQAGCLTLRYATRSETASSR